VLKEVYLFPVSGKEVNGFVKGGVKKSFFKIMMEEGGQAICCWRP
jgi:hypothetical protein